jgi:hypothetical protein
MNTENSRGEVLIGFADALAAIESAWSLRDAGFGVVAFARRSAEPALAASRSVRVVEVTAPEDDAALCAAEIEAIVAERAPVAVLPLDDHAVWVCDRAGLKVPVAGPTGADAEFALDKRLQIAAAEASGFAVPPRGDRGPWIVKPALAVVERDGRLLRPTGRLAATAAEADDIAAGIDGPVLVQDVVTGVGEGVFGLATATGVRAWSGHRRVRMMNPRGSGSSACRSLGVAEPERAATEKLLRGALDWHGLFMVELLRDRSGTAWFMEVNGRPWGSMALAVRRGFDYPAWAVRQALDPGFEPEEPVDPAELTCRHLGRELVHLAAVLRGAPSGADAEVWPGRLSTMWALVPRRGERWYNWRRGERRVFWRDSVAVVAGQLGGRSHKGSGADAAASGITADDDADAGNARTDQNDLNEPSNKEEF